MAQIAPAPYTSVPVPKTPIARPRIQTGAPQGSAPISVIRGWSFSSETDRTTMQTGNSLSLDPGQPEIILFFDALTPPTPPSSDLSTDQSTDPESNPGGEVSANPIEFRYRLDDYDADWTVTEGRNAHYRRLTPGHYQFEVQAHYVGQPWPETMAVLPVHQQPFFYQTWYFYLLLMLGMVALAAQMLTQRDQLLKGQMGMVLEERNRIASDCHDTLMAGFAAISWQLEATAKLFRESNAEDTPAAKSCELARSMVAHCQAEARRIIWDLRDPDEVTNVLSQALTRAITAHRLRESVETTFEVDGEEISIAPGAVHHLVCIGQEAVTNAIRHADASNIHVGLRYDLESLSLSVRDNGRGFHASSAAPRTGHFGIAVMEERARKLGGTLRLNSSAEVGTEVTVTVSFESINLPGNLQQHVVPWIGV